MPKKKSAAGTFSVKNIHMTGRVPKTAVALQNLTAALESLAPLHLAESWDNVGLLAGGAAQKIQRVLLTIDLTPQVRDEAFRDSTDLLISYHPPIFKPLKSLQVTNDQAPSLAIQLNSFGIAIYSPHTALDTAPSGTNDILAEKVSATITGSFSHYPAKGQYLKLVTFVPEEAVERVADALFAAGCGQIGAKSKYSCCSFRMPGTGTFFGDESTNPAVGQRGQLEVVREIRFETILPAHLAGEAVSALRQTHPYEEPAFDLLRMETPPEEVGLGRYAKLESPVSLAAFAQRCKKALGVSHVMIVGNPKGAISTLAIVAGSSGRLPLEKATQPYDCVLTGEMKHHDMLAYKAAGIAVIALGHGNTERPILASLAQRLAKQFPALGFQVSRADRDPFQIL